MWAALFGILDDETTLGQLSDWFALSFAINLTYPILVNFGRFTGKTIKRWADSEKVRILTAMAESKDFNSADFTRDLAALKDSHISAIWITNVAIIFWAALAPIYLFFLILYAAFHPEVRVVASFPRFAMLAMAVPVGLSIVGSIHLIARLRMWVNTLSYDGIIKYARKQTEKTVVKAEQDLAAARQPNQNA
jgi:hypothetical protein